MARKMGEVRIVFFLARWSLLRPEDSIHLLQLPPGRVPRLQTLQRDLTDGPLESPSLLCPSDLRRRDCLQLIASWLHHHRLLVLSVISAPLTQVLLVSFLLWFLSPDLTLWVQPQSEKILFMKADYPFRSTLHCTKSRDSHGGLSFVSTPAGSKGRRVVSNAEMNLLQQKTS